VCELFTVSSRFPASAAICLDELARHGGQTGPHRDGWGISYYDKDGAVRLYKEAEPASGSDWIPFLKKHQLSSDIVISHIRRASQGGLSLRNTQPFLRELGGRSHVFAHNGDLVDIKAYPEFKLGLHQPIGETDSEYAFCVLLGRLETLWLSCSYVPSLAQRLAIIVRFARDLRILGMANFSYSDGDAVFVHGNKRQYDASENPRPPGLHILHRLNEGNLTYRYPYKWRNSSSPEQQEQILVASVPLTAEAWLPMEEGEVIALRSGSIIARVGNGYDENITRQVNRRY